MTIMGFHQWGAADTAYNAISSPPGNLPDTGLGLVIFILAAALFIMAGLFFRMIWDLRD